MALPGGGFFGGGIYSTLGLVDKEFTTKIAKDITLTKKMKSEADKAGQQMKKMGMAMTAAGGVMLLGLTKASQASREFRGQLANITTLTTPAITNVGELSNKIRDLAIFAAKDFGDVAGGAYQVASAFGESALQGKSLEINVKGAAAGMATATEAINLTSAVTKGFGDTSDAAQQKVMDLSFITVKLGQTTFPELASSIGKTVPLMAAMGGKQEELFAGFATLTGVTGTAAEVSTQFSGILGAMIKPTGAMSKAIQLAGEKHLGLANASGKTLVQEMGLVEALKAIIGTTDGSMISMGKLIARKEALTAVLALTGGQADVFNEKFAAMRDSTGAADAAFEKITGGVNAAGFAMAQADIRMKDAALSIGEAVTPALAALKGIIAGVVGGIGSWMKAHPGLTKVIITLTAAIAGLMVVVGPVLIAIPLINANMVMLTGILAKAKVALMAVGGALKFVAANLGTIALAGAAAFAGWKIGRFIGETLGLDKAVRGLLDSLSLSAEWFDKLSMMKMGWTEKGKQALFLRDQIVELGKSVDGNVKNFREAAQAIRNNQEAYDNLHPRLKRIVDGMTSFKSTITETTKALSTVPARTLDMANATESIALAASARIKELTLSETDFKIEQLNREFQKNIDILNENRATKLEITTLERQHTLEINIIRKEAYEKQKKEQEAQDKEALKKKEAQQKARAASYMARQKQHETHMGFIENLEKAAQDMELTRITERDGWRAGELARLLIWHDEQKVLLYNRFNDNLINFQQYQEALTALNKSESDKREEIEKAADDEKNSRLQRGLQNFGASLTKATGVAQTYYNTLATFSTAFTKLKQVQLDTWYDNELQRINNSTRSNEEKDAAIVALDTQMHAKKAALESEAAAREKKLAIVQAVINTAVAVTKAISALPFPWNLPLIAFAIATGAAQIKAIGGAYTPPAAESYSPGGEGGGEVGAGGGGGVGGGGQGPGGGGGGMEGAAFQDGTGGFIQPPSKFTVGEPYSTEQVTMAGNLSGVRMNIVPASNRSVEPAAGGNTVNVTLNISALDAASFQDKFNQDMIPMIMEAIQRGLITIPRNRVG